MQNNELKMIVSTKAADLNNCHRQYRNFAFCIMNYEFKKGFTYDL